MKKKFLKESIQKSIKENILQEKITDIPAQALAGMANMGRNIAGQFSLGGVEKRFQRAGARIQKDWADTKDYVSQKAQKLSQSKNPMIAKQGQANLGKVDSISQQLDRALSIMNAPADSNPAANADDEFTKHPAQSEFEDWLKNQGVDMEQLSKVDRGKWHREWAKAKYLGLDPKNIPMKDFQQEIAFAAHKQHINLMQLDRALQSSNEFGMGLGLGPHSAPDADGGEGNEEPEAQTAAPTANKSNIKITPPGGQAASPGGKKGIFAQTMAQQQAKNATPAPTAPSAAAPSAPPSGGSSAPAPKITTKPFKKLRLPTPASMKKSAPAPTSPPPVPTSPPSPKSASPGMPPQTYRQGSGQVSPPPARPPKLEDVLNKERGEKEAGQEQPIPLTKKKPHKIDLPPKEQVVPSSIAGFMPPIKDDGKTIQVGSEKNPGAAPGQDFLKGKYEKSESKDTGKLSGINKLKLAAEKSKSPEDIEKYKKALAKEETNKPKRPAAKKTPPKK